MATEDALDQDVVLKLNNFQQSLENVSRHLKAICNQGSEFYSSLDLEDKSRHDLFLAYSVNSLFWTYLRTIGINPVSYETDGEEEKPHPVTDEIKRVRSVLERAKLIAKKKKASRLDQRAAMRFVRGSLWTPGQPGGVADQLRKLERSTDLKLKSEKCETKVDLKKE